MNRLFLAFLAFLFLSCALAAQTPAAQKTEQASTQSSTPTVSTTTQEVVLDMVFRDKKGKVLHDIRPDEIHVSEDGTDESLTSFRLVSGKTATPLSPAGTPTASGSIPLDPMREVRLVTLVFEGLDVDGKRFFRQAVKELLEKTPEQNLYFSVATIDQKLHLIQPFTNNHDELLKSLDKSATWGFLQYSNQSAEVKAQLKQAVSNGPQPIQSTGGGAAKRGVHPKRRQLRDGEDAVRHAAERRQRRPGIQLARRCGSAASPGTSRSRAARTQDRHLLQPLAEHR